MLERLQANQTLLFRLWLHSIDSCHVSWEEAWCRWSWRWGSGAAAGGWLVRLVDWVIDKAVGSRLTAVLNTDGQLCRGQGPVVTIHIQAEHVGV